MDERQAQPLDLYLTLGPDYKTLHIQHHIDGDAGFERFALRNIRSAYKQFLFQIPDCWMLHYRFSPKQAAHLKRNYRVDADYFQRLSPDLMQNGIAPRHILPLHRAMDLYMAGKPLLSSYRECPSITLENFLHPLANLRPYLADATFKTYTAVDTQQGALLYSAGPKGTRLLRRYLQCIADNFFSPQMIHTQITLSRLPAFDPAWEALANRNDAFDSRKLLQPEREKLLPSDILKNGLECLHYDLEPT